MCIERPGKMDQYVIIRVYSDSCSEGPQSYFLCLNIMYIVYYIRNEVTFTNKSI